MLVNMNDVLPPAKAGKYGVGFFNAVKVAEKICLFRSDGKA